MLDRKDLRAKISPEIHAQLVAIAQVDERDIGDIVEELVVRWVQKRVHDATVLTAALGRPGKTGSSREKPGMAGNGAPGAAAS